MSTTSHLALTLLEQSQAQKDVTVNEALARLDAILNTGAISRLLATPPVSPAEGDVYLIAATATDDWAGHDGDVAYYDGGIWRFILPQEGMTLWLKETGALLGYDGADWVAVGGGLEPLTDAATISWDAAQAQTAEVTLGGNRTLANPTGLRAGGHYHLIVHQAAGGGRTLSFGTLYDFAGGSAPVITSAATAKDVFSFVSDGTRLYCTAKAQNVS
jgi:hypothetical protein